MKWLLGSLFFIPFILYGDHHEEETNVYYEEGGYGEDGFWGPDVGIGIGVGDGFYGPGYGEGYWIDDTYYDNDRRHDYDHNRHYDRGGRGGYGGDRGGHGGGGHGGGRK